MSRLPKVALVGRPNVGKSALFNRICGKRIAIVDEAEGITRDRLYSNAEWFGRNFEVIDTGGIILKSPDQFADEIRRQAEVAIEEADALIQVVDGEVGITDLDLDVARILQRTSKPVCVAVNKSDTYAHSDRIYPFFALGIEKVVAVSAVHGFQIAELVQLALSSLPPVAEADQSNAMRVAIIGRPNVGKSTLVNRILDEERCIVSPIPGTTRDSVDIPFELDGRRYLLIDTAGIRRKGSEPEAVDKFASIRTERALERADICLLLIDSQQGMTTQEKRIATQIEESGKGLIVFGNKWDLVSGFRMEHCRKSIHDHSPFLTHCPVIFGSAQSGRNIDLLFNAIEEVAEGSKQRLTTGQLNRFLERAMQVNPPPRIQGKRFRIYYLTQVGTQPPRFLFFINHLNLLSQSYERYLHNQLRDEYGFAGNPLVFEFRPKGNRREEP